MLLLCNIIVTETIGALLGELTIGEMDKTLCVVNFLSYIDNKRRLVFGINIWYN